MATNYDINYEDERFTQVEADKQTALNNINNTYNNMVSQSDQFYQDQMDAVKDYANTQTDIQNQQTDFTIQKIEQQKDQAQKDYTKEQQGSYVDWQKQSNQYGANAEQMAASGLTNTGYSESSQTSMYNQYQSRVASAREVYNQAVLNYDNNIKEAKLANNSALAQIQFDALKSTLELSLQGFQYKNSLLSEQIAQQQATEDRYYSRWQDVLNQMNQENQFAESIRQYEQNYKFEQEQFAEQKAQFEKEYTFQIKQFDESIRQFDEEMARLKKKDKEEYALQIQQLELQKQKAQTEKAQWEKEYKLKQQQMNQEQARWEKEYALSKKQVNASVKASNQKSYTYDNTSNDKGKTDQYGNSASTQKKSDYYFKNGYQPQYVNNTKLKKSDLKVFNVFTEGTNKGNATKFGKQSIWQANGKYYVWDGGIKDYVDVTSQVKQSQKHKVNFDWGR